MQRRVLHLEREFLVLDKPAGLPVQVTPYPKQTQTPNPNILNNPKTEIRKTLDPCPKPCEIPRKSRMAPEDCGLPVQGGDGIHASVDSLLPHLRFDAPEDPRQALLRLGPMLSHHHQAPASPVPAGAQAHPASAGTGGRLTRGRARTPQEPC